MELIKQNFINTTTQFVVNSNTSTVGNIFLRDTRFQYASDTFDDDNTTVSMTINFDVTTTVDRIAVVEHNLKAFTFFYNGATANTFSLDAGSDTTTSDFSANSETSIYLRFTPVDCTSLTLDMKSTIVANQNKTIGYMAYSQLRTNFGGRVPSANNYDTTIEPKQVVHKLSDGGIRIQTVDQKFRSRISLQYVTTSIRDELKSVYDEHLEMIYVPFGTSTAWDEVVFPCVWAGGFNFYRYSDSASEAGFSGSIDLRETPL